jgi:hypothetical protein
MINTEPLDKKVSLNTPASVKTGRASTYEENGDEVEAKGKGGIGKKYERAKARKLEERRETLGEGKDGEVDEGADGRMIVECDKRVHLETV